MVNKAKNNNKVVDYKIQSIVLPSDEKHLQCRRLFYRGDHAILDRENNELRMGYAQRCDFVTYLNACSYRKWRYYTGVKGLKLHLDIQGKAELNFIGYSKDMLTVVRHDLGTLMASADKRQEVVYEFPDNDEQMVGFEITALEKTTIYGGYYTVEVEESKINHVVLSLATTTCKKEAFIKKNVELLKSQILSKDDEMAQNFYVHVVDNGRTLTDKDINGKHVFLHRNINSGGSGGFSRGMMESLHQNPEPTNVLLMDDDVLMLPESIRRTYNLLKLQKPEFKDYFISGAMLYYENPSCQHEDIGSFTVAGRELKFGALKGILNQEVLADNLECEKSYPSMKNTYAAWWYCCIPIPTIKKSGYSLPIFIREDDMEYAMRNNAKIITMNGICVWHMGFTTKYNGVFDRYQTIRNLLITQSTNDIMKGLNFVPSIYHYFRIEMLQFNYNCAELIIDALEDYNKGPSYIMNNDGEKLTLGKFKLNDKMIPLSDMPESESINFQDAWMDDPAKLTNRIILKLTWNGQRFTPKAFERPGVVPITFDPNIQPNKITLHSKLLAVNPFSRAGTYRIKDKKRFHELMRRYKKAMRYYKANREELVEEYRSKAKEMHSEKFWVKYLHLVKSKNGGYELDPKYDK